MPGARRIQPETLLPRSVFPLIPNPPARSAFALNPLNAALAIKSFQSQVKAEGAALAEGSDLLIVAPPREAKLKAIVLVLNAETVPHRLEPVGERQRIFVLVGQVDHGRAEDRPVALEQHSAGEPEFLLVAQILDRGIDVAVEPQVAELNVGLLGTDREVDLVPADGEIVLVDPIAVRDVDQASVADARPSDEVGEAIVKPVPSGKMLGSVGTDSFVRWCCRSTGWDGRAPSRAP